MKIGFIGLGIMGESMCENIVKKHDDTVYCFDFIPAKVELLASKGAVPCKDSVELAEKSDVIISMVPKSEHSMSVYKTILPVKDNVLPICDDDYLESDLTGKIVEFVKIVYGEDTLEENLKFIADALGTKGATPREAIRNYLDLLDQDLTTVDTVIKTGNAMTDAILNSKISLAKSKGIQVVADAHIPVKLKSSEIDLCCIIGNLFDNAIEASLPLPEDKRLIRVYMDMKNTQLYISFTNFTAGKKLPKLGGRFRTTKGEGHGFGLVRIDAIVARLDGYLSRNSEDGAFTTEILLPQE